MKRCLPESLCRLAECCPHPLYLVGGSVRDFLMGSPPDDKTDWDLASPLSEDAFLSAAETCGFLVRAVYRNTGTVKLEDAEGRGYEFTRFRSDTYVRGLHTPERIEFTDDIGCDARRRDFCANAVYYDIKNACFTDPLGGMSDIEHKILRTVRAPEQVFGEDGLRLMRLARIAAQTGFSPDEACLAGAREHAALIGDIAPERILAELRLLLLADTRHGDRDAPYRGLTLLKEEGVLARILPELALGENMAQRKDFHRYDVLEHSLRCVRYAALPREDLRFAALLHDVGKPFCYLRDGNFFSHPQEGERIARDILGRLKASKRLTDTVCYLIKAHMYDFDGRMKETKIRREIRDAGDRLELLFALKQADFSACRDDLSPAPTVTKWTKILHTMSEEGVPFSLRELALDGRDIARLGVKKERTAEVLGALLEFTLFDGTRNRRSVLERYVLKHYVAPAEEASPVPGGARNGQP